MLELIFAATMWRRFGRVLLTRLNELEIEAGAEKGAVASKHDRVGCVMREKLE